MINLELSKKIKFISFISIVMVIYIHNYNIKDGTSYFFDIDSLFAFSNIFIQNLFSEGFSRVSIPIFFIISAYLFFQNFTLSIYRYKIFKRIRTLLLPYLFWTSIVVLIHLTLQSIPILVHFFNKKMIVDLSLWELFIRTWINPLNYPLWFLRDLILLTTLVPIIFFFLKKLPQITLIIITIVWFLNTSLHIMDNNSLPFFFYGAYIALFKNEILYKKISNSFFVYLLIFYLVLSATKAYFLTIDATLEFTPFMILFQKGLILMGIITLWFAIDRVKLKSILFLTQFTFLFYVFHEPALTILEKGVNAFFGRSTFISLLSYLFLPFLIILYLTILGLFFKKYFPRFTSIITGYRV